MKVLLFNGSPHEKGCTFTALTEVAVQLENNGIETEIVQVGKRTKCGGCIACNSCSTTGKCVIDDCVNEILPKLKCADGFVFGSPVHFASPSGDIISFMDRLFRIGKNLEFKPACCVLSARRGGTTSSFDVLNKYFTITQMPIVSSNYWNMVHGSVPSEVVKDEEGMQTMRILADNMSWMLKSIEAGKKTGVPQPIVQDKIRTNFIR